MEVKRMSKMRELFAVIMAFAMVFAGIAIIATEADAVDAPELNLQGSVPYYPEDGTCTLTNESLGDYKIEKDTTGDSVVYNVTGYAFAQSVEGDIDTVFESWWTTNEDHVYGIIFDDGNGNQFLLYMNDEKLKQPNKPIEFEGNTYNLNINLEKATLVNNDNFAIEVAKGGTFIIDKDVSEITVQDTITLDKETTILGSGQKITYDGTERVFNVKADATFSNVEIIGDKAERGINVQAGNIIVTLNNVDMVIDHYALNIPTGMNKVTFNVTGGTIQGYCAFQTWSNDTTATFTDSTLIGYNKWTSAGGWNDFATIVVNDYVTGANIVLKNCNVNEQSTQNDNVRAHELAVRVSSDATGSIAFTDGTVITPLDEEDVIRTNSDFKVTDDGTTDVVGLDSFNDCVVFTDAEDGDVIVAVITESGDVYYPNAQAALDDIVNLLKKYDDITIEAEGTLEIKHNIVINDGKTLTIIGATIIVPVPTTAGYVYEKYIHVDADGSLVLESADIRVPVIVEEGAYVSITKPKEMTVDGDATADLGVGYGNTLVLSNLTVPAGKYIEAYGNVVIGGNVTIQKGAQFKVHPGGNAQIDGALTIEGTAEIRGDTIVNGSVKVYNADGGAIFQTDNTTFMIDASSDLLFEPTITVSGTMDVLKSKSKEATVDNRLIANADLVVEGTLTVTGTFNGDIRDRGTVVFNGTAGDNASITIYDGISITIASVTGGVLAIKDDIDDSEYTQEQLQSNRFSDENTVVLDEVKGITVSTELTDTVKTMVNGDKIRYHVMTMTVSGTFSAVDDEAVGASSVMMSNNVDAEWPIDMDSEGIVVADVTLGKNVALVLDGENIDVDGTVNVIAEGSSIRTAQTVDVDGMIVVGEDAYRYGSSSSNAESELLVNGAHYEVESEDRTEYTCYYTTLETALSTTGIYNDEIDVFGTVDVDTELQVPAGITVTMAGGSHIDIDVDGKLIVAVTAFLDADYGTIDVDGMLVIMDKESGLDGVGNVTYQGYCTR